MTLVVHADWSVAPRKRWMTVIAPGGDGRWALGAPELVGPPGDLLARLRVRAADAPVAFGIDCPLGLPRAYVARHAGSLGADDFPGFLSTLSRRPAFLRVAGSIDEVSVDRPFYPDRGLAGMTRAAHAQALGLDGAAALCRACDRATAERPAGAPVFWTLGANQSGKAAISAWRDVIAPALASAHPPLLWPFAGPFRSLLAPGAVAIAETYPAEALRQLGLKPAGSKRRQSDRAAHAPAIEAAMQRLAVRPSPQAISAIATGFGADSAGEDRLDCLLGALCVLAVVTGARPDIAPADPWIARWEGWVLGQTALPAGC